MSRKQNKYVIRTHPSAYACPEVRWPSCAGRHRARQVAFLRKNGIRHYLDAHDWPVVLRAAIGEVPPPVMVQPVWKPDKVA